MSRKPTIKISYPEASEKALLLTEAMVKRAPGKRVVETESEDPIFPDGGELFSGFIRCKTQTGVELTLTLNSSSMDYALETLIKPNLTADERKRILGEDVGGDDLLSSAQAAEAPGQALDGSSSPDVPSAEQEAATQGGKRHLDLENIIHGALEDHMISAEYNDKLSFAEDLARRIRLHEKVKAQSGEQEKQIEFGKIPDRDLRTILADLVDATQGYVEGGLDAWKKHIENVIETAIKEIDHRAGVIEEEDPALIQKDTTLLDMLSVLICGAIRVNNKRITELKTYALNLAHYLNDGHPDDKKVFAVAARDLADALFSVQHDFAEDANRTLDAETLVRKNKRIDEEDRIKPAADPSWDDVEAEARQMQASALKQSAAPLADDGGGEIEPGLLNDIENGEEGKSNG